MYIKVESPENNFTLRLPSAVIINSLTAGVASRAIKKHAGMEIPAKTLRRAVSVLRKYKKRHPDWTFIEVRSANGEHIVIKL